MWRNFIFLQRKSCIEIYAVFVLNLRGEKSVWRKNDKYEVWQTHINQVSTTGVSH